ncbi:MAG: metalloregulator ArsR/SmtB family transcription factor [Pyrinomonadaceae bacterium]
MDVFTALAEPTRRNILEMLAAQGNLSATDIYRNFKSSPQAISQHLKVLKDADLVRVEKRAQQRIYYVSPDPLRELERWIKQFADNIDKRYQALDKILEMEKQKLNTEKEQK